LCWAPGCVTHDEYGELYFRDPDHLTNVGSDLLIARAKADLVQALVRSDWW